MLNKKQSMKLQQLTTKFKTINSLSQIAKYKNSNNSITDNLQNSDIILTDPIFSSIHNKKSNREDKNKTDREINENIRPKDFLKGNTISNANIFNNDSLEIKEKKVNKARDTPNSIESSNLLCNFIN